MLVNLKYDNETLEDLFPCLGFEGQNVQVSAWADQVARIAMRARRDSVLVWHTPDTFAVRYGSSYVASAMWEGRKVRFHQEEGTFKEGDDK